jgi:hypothetical protein
MSTVKGPRVLPTRRTEREGIRELVGFFEDNDCVVQPVAGENDFGKDVYVDLTRDARVTGLTFAGQVKSGTSYRAAGGYRIPIDQHAECWRASTTPVLGFVYDPEPKALFWVNITAYLREHLDPSSHIPVPATNRLTTDGLPALQRSVREASHGLHPLVGVWTEDVDQRRQAVWDCLALGRRDARVLIGLRAAVPHLGDEVLRDTINVLSLVTSHPDVWWNEHNWIEQPVRRRVRATFDWTIAEITGLVCAAELEWERGTVGQAVLLLLSEDANIREKLLHAVRDVYRRDVEQAWMLFCLFLHFCDQHAGEALVRHIEEFAAFRDHGAYSAVVDAIEEGGRRPVAE